VRIVITATRAWSRLPPIADVAAHAANGREVLKGEVLVLSLEYVSSPNLDGFIRRGFTPKAPPSVGRRGSGRGPRLGGTVGSAASLPGSIPAAGERSRRARRAPPSCGQDAPPKRRGRRGGREKLD
jgi:hypothetical protein